MKLSRANRIFMHGIGGMGMRGLAQLLSAQGKTVVGTDQDTEKLRHDSTMAHYTIVAESDAAELLRESDLMIYSDAVPATHPLRQAATKQSIPMRMLFEAVGELSQNFTTIAIAGTHGKSSTTALVAHILTAAGLDPTVLVGAAIPAWQNQNARVGQSKYFVVEADEYRDHFLALHPTHAIITTIDFDHPDYFKSYKAVIKSFQTFVEQVDPAGTIVTSTTTRASAKNLRWPANTKIIDLPTTPLPLSLPGEHMQHNAALALALVEQLGVSHAVALQSLTSFTGLQRRFEILGSYQGMTVISDYGHHPTEIAATLMAVRTKYPDKKILAVLEPHTDERLRALFPEFVAALSGAPVDGILLCPVFRAEGRQVQQPVSTGEMKEKFSTITTPLEYLTDYEELADTLKRLRSQYDVAIAFTAGVLDSKLRALVESESK